MYMRSIAAFLLLNGGPCFADQCAWNQKDVADAAAKLLPVGTAIRSYCAPCGDKSALADVVHTVVVEKVPDSSDPYYRVKINDQNVDLAYTFISSNGGWTNLAFITKCPDYDGSAQTIPTDTPVK